uniref:Uncharacterized protein n=1 Tax=Oryza sativa subsp. japonica TaxID=39947 RepID=Q6ZLQ3_ORYSJ|nr:hypothetical protein [Oryza sativa Japonica Group]
MGMSSPVNTGRTGGARRWMEQARPRQYCNHEEELDGGGNELELTSTMGRSSCSLLGGAIGGSVGGGLGLLAGGGVERCGRTLGESSDVGHWGWVVATLRRALGESSDVGCWGGWQRRHELVKSKVLLFYVTGQTG